MKQSQIIKLINRELKREKVFSLEDEFVIALTEDIVRRSNILENSFDSFIKMLSESILKNSIDFTEIIKTYKALNDEVEIQVSNKFTEIALDSKRDLVNIIQNKYAEAIYKVFGLADCVDMRLIDMQYQILNKRLINKVTEILDDEVDKRNEILMGKNDIVFELLLQMIDNLDDEEDEDIKEFKRTMKKYKHIESHKEMNKIAERLGFKYKSQNGSHRKFEHQTTNKCVTIPQHDLGVSLSYKIQKELDSAMV